MPSKSWAIIYSPKEGSPRTHKRWNKIRHYLDEQGITYDFVQSEGPGSIERLASMMTRAGYNTIIVIGGDSALNHALCGIMKTESPLGGHPAIGVIPNGFGNDFAKFWGYSSDDYKKTIDSLLLRRLRKVDVGVVNFTIKNKNKEKETLYFLNCINLGVASSITNLKRKTSSILTFKTASYFTSALLLSFQRMKFHFRFNLNGEFIEQNAMTVCVGSAHGYGLTPSAVPYNGLLDITLVSKPQIFQIIQGLGLLFTGRFLSHRGVKVWRTKEVKFESIGHAILSLDGRVVHEPIEQVDVNVMPSEIDFIIP